jgi:PAS domain S-box-containing protein
VQEIHVLHLEDDPFFADMIASMLLRHSLIVEQESPREEAWRFVVRSASTRDEFEAALAGDRFDLILCDHLVPGGDGIDALNYCRIRFPSVPFIFVSGKMGEDLAIKSLGMGATDYVLKANMSRFIPTVMRALRSSHEATALREAQARIRRDQANLRALIENTSDAIWSMGLDFNILVFNSAASLLAMKMSGQPMTVGTDFLQHLPEEARGRWRAAAMRARNRERFREEYLLTWNGVDYEFEMSFNPISNDGIVTGMAVFGKDMAPAARPSAQSVKGSASKAQPVSNPDAAGPAAPRGLAASAPMRILVVDDNQVNQLVLSGFLEKFGYSAELANNGLEAVEANRKRPFDLIFMDCRMPVMDGFGAVRAIRAEEIQTGERAWITAMTADVTPGIKDRCLEAGMDGYLSKPLPLDTLRETLEMVARERKARRVPTVPAG